MPAFTSSIVHSLDQLQHEVLRGLHALLRKGSKYEAFVELAGQNILSLKRRR